MKITVSDNVNLLYSFFQKPVSLAQEATILIEQSHPVSEKSLANFLDVLMIDLSPYLQRQFV